MSRFLPATFAISILATNLLAQAPTPTSPAPTSSGRPPLIPAKSPALPSPSPSGTPTMQELVDSLGPADLQAVITLLKSNFTNPDAITDTELNRATVEGLMVRLPRGVMLLPGKENPSAAAPRDLFSEMMACVTGTVRVLAVT